MKKLLLTVLCLFCLFSAVGCIGKTPDIEQEGYVILTFVQEGEKDKVFQIKEGGDFTQIPIPKTKAGYDVVWERTEFFALTQNLTVRAIYTPKKYVITYELGILEETAIIETTTQTVTYNTTFTLFTPVDKTESYVFKGWKLKDTEEIFTSGTYKKTENVTLVAQWQSEWSGDYT